MLKKKNLKILKKNHDLWIDVTLLHAKLNIIIAMLILISVFSFIIHKFYIFVIIYGLSHGNVSEWV